MKKKLIMPTNLNALIRYKQIDACLKNQYVKCTIERLQEACTQSMGDSRGIYKLVSERTIRDDIRVMRSNILGFNAPIEYEDGKYFYSDEEYSIFNTPVTEVDLLRDILTMLLEERNNIADAEIDRLIIRISIIVGRPLPAKFNKPSNKDIEIKSSESGINYSKEKPKPSDQNSMRICGSINESYFSNRDSRDMDTHGVLLWKEILSILGE